MKTHFCVDCKIPVSLNTAGRCEWCNSDAVDSLWRPNRQFQFTGIVRELDAVNERLLRAKGVAPKICAPIYEVNQYGEKV